MRATHVDAATLLGVDQQENSKEALDSAISKLLYNDISTQTRATLEKQLDDPQILQASLDDKIKQINVGTVTGLVLGAPEFQRR